MYRTVLQEDAFLKAWREKERTEKLALSPLFIPNHGFLNLQSSTAGQGGPFICVFIKGKYWVNAALEAYHASLH